MRFDTATTLPGHEDSLNLPGRRPPMRVALVCDMLEEGWASMDLFGDMLNACYQSGYAAMVSVEQLRPPLRTRLSRLPFRRAAGALWNADRLINRFFDYPRWLKQRAARFDLFHLIDHSYGQLSFALPRESTVVTCHDLDTFRCLLEPDREPRPRWFRQMAQKSLSGFQQCAHVICPSEATRSQLLAHKLFPERQVTVIPPGVDPAFLAESQPEPAMLPKGLERLRGQNYLLHVGSTIRRKRVDVLLRVFSRLRQQFPELLLLRVGGALTSEQLQLAAKLGVLENITFVEGLTKEQLATAYRNAAVLLQTSDAEGFGLPVIEAMACGCVVIASDIAALREAGGSAASYAAPADIRDWTETVAQILHESKTAPDRWQLRKQQARRHAAAFTWPENARRTIAIYGCVLNAAGSCAGPKI